ncbi:MAG: SDR family oxidoreductase [Bacteroidia bacterium]
MSRNILITGASTGIGAATAELLAPGNTIFIHYNRSKEPAEKVAESVSARGGKSVLIQADLSTEAGCYHLVEELKNHTDTLDVLFNNAGGLIERQKVTELQWDTMAEIFALNTLAPMLITRLCVPLLEKGTDPSIVNMTSIAIRHGAPTATAYGASKSAIDSFTRGAARELAPKIRVNAVAPGVILTPFHEKYSTPDRLQTFAGNTPLQRNGVSEHIAKAVVMLVENDFITGETIDINGGLFMR